MPPRFKYLYPRSNGLEQILVEKYYVSNANDAAANAVGGVLPCRFLYLPPLC